MELPEFLSTRTVAKIIGVSPQTIRQYCECGKLRATRTPGLIGDWHICTEGFLCMDKRYEDELRKVLNERFERNKKLVEAVKELANRPGMQELLDEVDRRRVEPDSR